MFSADNSQSKSTYNVGKILRIAQYIQKLCAVRDRTTIGAVIKRIGLNEVSYRTLVMKSYFLLCSPFSIIVLNCLTSITSGKPISRILSNV